MIQLLRSFFGRFSRLSSRSFPRSVVRRLERDGARPASNDRRDIMHSDWARIGVVCTCGALVVAMILSVPLIKSAVHANRVNRDDVARRYPNFTAEQRLAVLRQIQSELHPRGRDLTFEELIARFTRYLTSASNGYAPAANFTGNLTTVTVSDGDLFALNQQSDCSLTLDDAAYTVNMTGPLFSYTVDTSIPHYEQVLHNAAGLTTTPDKYPAGCGDTNVGVTSRKIVFTGTTTGGNRVYAGHFYNSLAGRDQIFTSIAKTNDTLQTFNTLSDPNSVVDLATSDLNGDGNGDLVAIENSTLTTGGTPTASVFLGKADGTFSTPTEIDLPGTYAISAVIDDFNGDGKKDLVVSTFEFPSGSGGSVTFYVNFLAGNGDGTFKPVQSYTETPPASVPQVLGSAYFGLISADLRGSGHKDLVASSGIVLFGNGDGTFSQSATLAFPSVSATSQWGPNVVAADFNKDGKLDLALDNGDSIQIFTGKGDGTFTLKSAYSTIGNVGYLVAQDIDGDGNVDLWSGSGNNGSLGSDQFEYNGGYALMGNGDGTFRGASSQSFAYTGTNVGDLTGNNAIDAVGVNSNGSFTSYLGDGKGNFTAGPSLVFSPITIGGTAYTVSLDSYSVGDINGDGFADLVYLGTNFYGPNYVPGIFVATGKGDGSFNAPVFIPAPAFIRTAPDFDVNPTISGIRVADFNHDGKLDIVYTYNTLSYVNHNYYSGIAIQLGNGDGTFKTMSQLTQLYSGASAPNPGAYEIGLIGDVNKDNNADLFVLSGLSANSQGFTMQTYLGNGDGSFKAPTTVAGVLPGGVQYGTQWAPIVLADMNGDGAPDIVALQLDATSQNLQVAIALGNGDGTFKAPNLTTYNSQYINGTGLAVADFNGDGKLDVATLSFLGPAGSGIALGNGDGTLQTGGSSSNVTPAQSFFVGGGGATLALDLNGDGKPDILNGSVVLLNQGASTVVNKLTPTVTVTPSAATITSAQGLTVTIGVSGASGNPTPTGSVTLTSGGYSSSATTLTAGSATINVAAGALATGTDTLTVSYSGDTNYGTGTGTGSVTVTAAPVPSFALSNSGNINVIAGATTGNVSTITVTPSNGFTGAVGLTCAITGPAGATSPATCSFVANSVSITGATALTDTLTVATTSATTAGAYTVTVTGTSGTITQNTTVNVTVAAAAASFALTNSGAITVGSPGATTGNASTITVTPSGGFTGSVALAAALSTGPVGASDPPTFSFGNSSPVIISGTTAGTGTLTVLTTAAISGALVRPKLLGDSWYAAGGATLACLLLFGIPGRRRRMRRMLGMLLLLAALTSGVASCGGGSKSSGGGSGNPGTTTGSYTITVTGTAGSITKTTVVNLTVN